MPTIIPLYCNRFFPRCKYFFLEKPYFFQKFPDRTEQLAHGSTDGGNNPLQRLSHGQPEGQGPQQQPRHLSHADIPAADTEGQMEPGIPDARHEQSITEGGVPGPKGPEQFIHRPQTHSHQYRGGKLSGRNSHRRHLNRRLAQLPRWRGSS